MKLVDVRGRRSPMLIADLTREMRDAPAGHAIEVLTDFQSTVDALVLWCREQRHRLVSIDTIEGDLRIVLQKGERLPRPQRKPGDATGSLRALS
jgi:TusA-related sulfurtransferase